MLPPPKEIVLLFGRSFTPLSDPEGVTFHSPGRSPGLRKERTFVALKGRHSRGTLATDMAHRNHALSGLQGYVVTIPRAAPWAMESRRFAATAAFGHLSIFPKSRRIPKASGRPESKTLCKTHGGGKLGPHNGPRSKRSRTDACRGIVTLCHSQRLLRTRPSSLAAPPLATWPAIRNN